MCGQGPVAQRVAVIEGSQTTWRYHRWAMRNTRNSAGTVLFYWDKQQLGQFYSEMASLPLDVIYLGETVCSKRRAFNLDQWLGLGRELHSAGNAQIVLSSLTLIEAASELSSLRRLCDNGEVLVEANDMAQCNCCRASCLCRWAG